MYSKVLTAECDYYSFSVCESLVMRGCCEKKFKLKQIKRMLIFHMGATSSG